MLPSAQFPNAFGQVTAEAESVGVAVQVSLDRGNNSCLAGIFMDAGLPRPSRPFVALNAINILAKNLVGFGIAFDVAAMAF